MYSKSNLRVLVVNHTLDQSHPLLGHQIGLANALAQEFFNVFVFTSHEPISKINSFQYAVSSRSFKTKILRALGLIKDFLDVIKSFRPDLVFFHMTPNHCAIFSPILKLLRIKIILWYAHVSVPFSLICSEKLVNLILTPTLGSISLKSSKVVAIGHHIDFDFFYAKPKLKLTQTALVVGRLDRSKRIKEIFTEVSILNSQKVGLKIHLVGKPSSPSDESYMKNVFAFAKKMRIEFEVEEISNKQDLRSIYQKSDVFMHAALGSLDKAPLEAQIAGLPVASENPEFLGVFGTWSDKYPATLANELITIYEMSPEFLAKKIKERQKIAQEFHSIENWVSKFRTLAEELTDKY